MVTWDHSLGNGKVSLDLQLNNRGVPPYAKIHPMRVLFIIPQNEPPRLDATFSEEFRDFVAKCLVKRASQRPTAQQLLEHPFIKKAPHTTILMPLITKHKEWKNIHEKEDITSEATKPSSKKSSNASETILESEPWDFDSISSIPLISSSECGVNQLPRDKKKKGSLGRSIAFEEEFNISSPEELGKDLISLVLLPALLKSRKASHGKDMDRLYSSLKKTTVQGIFRYCCISCD